MLTRSVNVTFCIGAVVLGAVATFAYFRPAQPPSQAPETHAASHRAAVRPLPESIDAIRRRRGDAFGRTFSELRLSEPKIRRLRELIGVSDAAALEMEAEIGRGAYPSRREALAAYVRACTEAETEIQALLIPAHYARFEQARDEVPVRSLINLLDGAIDVNQGGTVFSDEAFEKMIALAQAGFRRHGARPDNFLPENATDEPTLDRYLRARAAADAEIATGAAAFLDASQLASLQRFQADELATLRLIGRQAPAVPWAQRR